MAPPPRTTQIGSLPAEMGAAEAIDYSFEHDVPFHPQPAHVDMIREVLDPSAWPREWSDRFFARLARWAPSAAEPWAKVQVAGPITLANYGLSHRWQGPLKNHPELFAEACQRLEDHGRMLIDRVKACGAYPLVFIDEPGLVLAKQDRTVAGHTRLNALIVTLTSLGATVGLHCCGQTDWNWVLQSGAAVISFDAALSLESILSQRDSVERFFDQGGAFAVGLIAPRAPTNAAELNRTLSELKPLCPAATRFVTPACGLSSSTTIAAAATLDELKAVKRELRASAREG